MFNLVHKHLSHPKFPVFLLDKWINVIPDICIGVCGDLWPFIRGSQGAVDLQVLSHWLFQFLLVNEQAAHIMTHFSHETFLKATGCSLQCLSCRVDVLSLLYTQIKTLLTPEQKVSDSHGNKTSMAYCVNLYTKTANKVTTINAKKHKRLDECEMRCPHI